MHRPTTRTVMLETQVFRVLSAALLQAVVVTPLATLSSPSFTRAIRRYNRKSYEPSGHDASLHVVLRPLHKEYHVGHGLECEDSEV
jgi:hypothetical protein